MVDGKRGKVTIGPYPVIVIKAARDAHEAMRVMLASGTDPARQKQLDKIEVVAVAAQTPTFESFTRTWFDEKMAHATERSKKQNLGWLVNDVFPAIGAIQLGQLHSSDVLKLLEKMRNTPTKANSIRAVIERVYQYGAQKLLVTHNPATAMKGLIDKPPAKHYPPIDGQRHSRVCWGYQGVRRSRGHPDSR